MHISKRIHTLVSMIEPCTSLADIGCDHGYVPISAYKRGKIRNALAVDIHSGPLRKTMANIDRHGLAHAIAPLQCDGLTGIAPGEVETAVIAGMGGRMIREILLKSPDVVKNLRQIILQPQLDVDIVRKTVHEIGFKIDDEAFLLEAGKFYSIINCHMGLDVLYNHRDYTLGKILIQKKDGNLRLFLQLALGKLEKVKKQVSSSPEGGQAIERLGELDDLEKMYREVLVCL